MPVKILRNVIPIFTVENSTFILNETSTLLDSFNDFWPLSNLLDANRDKNTERKHKRFLSLLLI